LTKDPMRSANLGFDWSQSFNSPGSQSIKVPPARPVGAKAERAIGGPIGLNDCIWSFPCRAPRRMEHAFFSHIRNVKPCAIPRHIGMVPGDKGELIAQWRKPRRTQKIRALEQNRFGLARIERQAYDRGLWICGGRPR
jgi:hypothetical protein